MAGYNIILHQAKDDFDHGYLDVCHEHDFEYTFIFSTHNLKYINTYTPILYYILCLYYTHIVYII
jgi:hypothetical protein